MNFRKVLFWIHLTTGCLAGTVVLLMSVTGLLLTYERQIIRRMDHGAQSAAPVADSVRQPIETIVAGVSAQHHEMPSTITLRADPSAPAEVGFGRDIS